MAFYVVLHHPSDPHQPWANVWRRGTDDELEAGAPANTGAAPATARNAASGAT